MVFLVFAGPSKKHGNSGSSAVLADKILVKSCTHDEKYVFLVPYNIFAMVAHVK